MITATPFQSLLTNQQRKEVEMLSKLYSIYALRSNKIYEETVSFMEKIGQTLLRTANILGKRDSEHEIVDRIVSDYLNTQNYARWDNFYRTT